MEPIKAGAYQRAMEKRGPGVHHFAIDVLNLEIFLRSIVASGWLLHPVSVETMKRTKTAYLARPGFPALIEVQEREAIEERSLFVEKVEIEVPAELGKLLPAVNLAAIVCATETSPALQLHGVRVPLVELI
jgi:hypothetical protein